MIIMQQDPYSIFNREQLNKVNIDLDYEESLTKKIINLIFNSLSKVVYKNK